MLFSRQTPSSCLFILRISLQQAETLPQMSCCLDGWLDLPVRYARACGAPGQATPKCASVAYDYFELKSLKKRATQEAHSYSLFCFPESRKYISHVKGALPESGGTKTFLSPKIGTLGMRNLYKQTCDFFHGLKPKLCSDSLRNEHQNLSFSVLSFLINLLFLCLKSTKAICFGHFLDPISMGPPCA